MKIIQINTLVNSGSTGRIAEDIGKVLISKGHESYIAFGRCNNSSDSNLIRIGSKSDQILHGIKTRIFDRHGFGSGKSSERFIKTVEIIKPDVIHLHNIHGYYLNIKVLFNYLKKAKIPIVWTFHDCWPFTGHCSYFDRVNCFKWQVECFNCPNLKGYPASWFLDSSQKNFLQKRELFTGMENLTLVSPSEWLGNHLRNSFMNSYPVRVIKNGVDLHKFKPIEDNDVRRKYNLGEKRFLLGVANIWDKRKGLTDFVKLRSLLDSNINIILVGLSSDQIRRLPAGIKGINRTDSIDDLASLYSAADLFVNPTHIDNFPTTNIEALACGTPIISYATGGCPEAVDKQTGWIVRKGDIASLKKVVYDALDIGKEQFRQSCRNRAESLFNKDDRCMDYVRLYEEFSNSSFCKY